MRRLVLVVLFTFAAHSNAFALAQTSTGFYYPTGSSSLGSYAGWLAVYPDYFTGEYHLGKDIAASFGDPVYAIADGSVYYITKHGWSGLCSAGQNCSNNCCSAEDDYPTTCGYCNVGVVVKHRLSDGTYFLALYAHVQTSVGVGDKVKAGVQFATVGHWPYGDHLHFGIHPAVTLPKKFGFDYTPVTSPYWGWVDPIDYITANTPIGAPTPPAAAPPAIYTELYATQTPHTVRMAPGTEATFTVQYQNTGNKTWKGAGYTSSDPDYVELRACNDDASGATHDSGMYPGSGWISAQRVGPPTQSTIAPSTSGSPQYADFSFTAKVPATQPSGSFDHKLVDRFRRPVTKATDRECRRKRVAAARVEEDRLPVRTHGNGCTAMLNVPNRSRQRHGFGSASTEARSRSA